MVNFPARKGGQKGEQGSLDLRNILLGLVGPCF